MIAYHVTSLETYRDHIKDEGLVPKMGIRSWIMHEKERRTYFFNDLDSLEDGMMNWLGDALEADGIKEIAILKVDLSGLNAKKTFDDETSWEMYVTEPVSPDRIELVRTESLDEELNESYVYHGTSEGAFRKIREQGLIPREGKSIYFADSEQYARSYAERKGNKMYGYRVLRTPKTDDMIPDKNTNFSGDFKTTKPIPPQDLELKVDGEWIPVQRYSHEEFGIKPINEIIRKLPNGKYRLYSKKKNKKGKRKNLGTYDTLDAVKQRERDVQYFKHESIDWNLKDIFLNHGIFLNKK